MFGTATLISAMACLAALLPDRVHHVGGVQHEQPRLVDLDARLGDALERDVVLGQRACRRPRAHARACTSAPARARPRRSGACSGGCGRARAGPGRSRSRGPRRAACWPPAPARSRTAPRRGRAARRRSRTRSACAATLMPGVSRGHQDHRLLLVAVRVLRVGLAHEDEDLAARVADARGPPLVAVDHVASRRRARCDDSMLVASEEATSGSVIAKAERILPSSSGSSHCFLCSGGAVALEHLHVAGVGRRAVEDLGRRWASGP